MTWRSLLPRWLRWRWARRQIRIIELAEYRRRRG